MMKVDITQEIFKSAHATTVQKNGESQDKGFGKILDETMKTSSNTNAGGLRPPVMNGIREMQLQPFPISNQTPVFEGTERLLNILDEYRQKLGDREVALGEIDPLISKISKQSERLTTKINSLPEGDPLKEILNQALIISSLEVMKFNRGDYNAP